MAREIVLNTKDLLVMNLVNYFITEENYNPILVHGIDNEIWLENMNSSYKVVRIISNHIHNNEQLKLDTFKLEQVVRKLKKSTLSFKMKVLNIYTDLGETVNLNNNLYDSIFVSKISDIKNPLLIEVFPNIIEKTKHKEKGIDLFVKITDNINKISSKKNKVSDKIFAKKKPIVTYIIMGLCVFIYALMLIVSKGSINGKILLLFGANLDILTKAGEYYRLLTCTFIHLDFIHIFFNLYALYIIGPQVENFFGKTKFLFIYLVSGISGSILSLAFSPNTISAGASGAIFGLMGALLYFGNHYRGYLGNVIKSQIMPIIILNILLGFILTGVDNAGHIGGLIGGLLVSMAMGVESTTNKSDKINGWIMLLIYLGFIIYLGFLRG